MDTKQYVADLTVEQLQALIRRTVQEAVAEVMIEFAITSELEAEIEREAEIVDYLRSVLHPPPARDNDNQTHLELDD